MDIEQLKNLISESNIDMNQISKLLTDANNKSKLNVNDVTNLLTSLMSNIESNQKTSEIKDMKNMSESEKIIYRNELKNKLKNKQNSLKQSRMHKIIKNNTKEKKSVIEESVIKESVIEESVIEQTTESEQTIEDYLL